MKTNKTIAWLLILTLTFLCMAGCGTGETSTVTGMVVAVDGTVISFVEMDMESMGDFGGERAENGERPEMPEGMEGEMPEGFDPENFDGEMPEGFDPENFDGEMPEGFDPENFSGMMPGGFDPENFDGEMPEGVDPENFDGEMPEGAEGPSFNMDTSDATSIDLKNVHISVEIDGGKATGSMDDIQPGTFVTITMNKKGKAENVLVSASSGFGRGFSAGNE